jgi:hypothetical protein
MLTGVEAIGGANPVRAVLVLVMLSAIHQQKLHNEIVTPELRFDDLPEPAVATLGSSRE